MLRFADGFGTYGNSARMVSSGLWVWTTNSGSEPIRIGSSATYLRTGTYYWDASGQVYNNWYGGRMVGGDQPILGAGAAFYFAAVPGADNYCPFMFCGDNKDDFQVSVRVKNDGSLAVHQGKDGAELDRSAAGLITAGAYSYIEMRVFADAVNGSVEVRVNNTRVILVTGVNTMPLGYARLNGVMSGTRNLNATGAGVICQAISDYVIWDAQGTENNDFIGDCRCRTFFPVADGPEQDWTPTGAATNWEATDAVPYNDAIYSAAANVGDKVNFSKAALPINTAYVAGVQLFASVNKTDAGTCEVTPQLVGSDGVAVANGTVISPGTGTGVYTSQFDVDPTTGATFTRLNFDAALIQMERTA